MTQLATALVARARRALSLAVRRVGRGPALPKAALAAALSVVVTGCGTGLQIGATDLTTSGAAGAHTAVAASPSECTSTIRNAAVDEMTVPAGAVCRLIGTAVTGNLTAQGAGRVLPIAGSFKHAGRLVAADDTGPRDAVGRTAASVARVASFNVLGNSHTAPGGNSSNHIDGRTRMRWTVRTLTEHAIDIVGLQEFEPVQETAFTELTAGSWSHFPYSGGQAGSANVVAWRSDLWTAVATYRLPVPYFHGHPMGMPYVLLEDSSGHRVWVISVHNPADTRGPAKRFRSAAVRAEAHLVARLHANGIPVILTGDMNDRASFFCTVTAMAPVHAANGGATGSPCQPPSPMGIDWIVGTSDVTFDGYTSTRHSPINRASDHSMVYANIALQ
jgi:endonuclease/exonuclease/phosphatase family metal-dependent hydrolase